MVDEKRVNYPCIPEKSWWILREKFKESVPSELSKFYVSNMLNISPKLAWDSVIRQMRMIGLIDDRGKPTDLAHKWKDDKKYMNACARIVKKLYPRDLIELFPNSSAPTNEVAKWFKEVCLCEESIGKRCAEFYLMLTEGDPARGEELLINPNKPLSKKPEHNPAANQQSDQRTLEKTLWQTTAKNGPPLTEEQSNQPPAIHFDFHIHISPETTPEMVDKIFKKIAQHLKPFKNK